MTWLIQKTALVVFLTIFPTYLSLGQSTNNDTGNSFYEWFDNQTGAEASGLYNGVQYVNDYIIFDENHQFFSANSFTKGKVVYDNHLFTAIDFKYDLYNDDLILAPSTSSGSFPFKLIKNKVQSFSLNKSKFVNVNKINETVGRKDIGYCELLWESDSIKCYRKIKKTPKKITRQGKVNYEFIRKDRFYLHYNENLYPIDSKTSWVSAFPAHKATIKTFFQANKKQLKKNVAGFHTRLSMQIDKLLKRTVALNEK